LKKIDQLFIDFPELIIIKTPLKRVLELKKFHILKTLYKRYRIRKPKHYDTHLKALQTDPNPWNRIGASMYFDYFYWGTNIFNLLDRTITVLKEKDGIKHLLNKLIRNPDQFFDTLSELEFNAYWGSRYPLELEPRFYYQGQRYKELDSKIILEQRNILFEVFTPKMSK